MLKTLTRIVLIGLIVGTIPFGYLSAQSKTKGTEWGQDPREKAKEAVSYFLESYYNNTSPDGLGLKQWIIEVTKNCGWLRRLGDMRVIEPFIELLKDTTRFPDDSGLFSCDEIHSCIAITLGQLRAKKAIPILKECLNRKAREMTRMESAIALCFLGEAKLGLPVLEEYAKRNPPPNNPWGGGLSRAFFTFDWQPIALPKDNQLLESYMKKVLRSQDPDVCIYAALWLIKSNQKKYARLVFEPSSRLALDKTIRGGFRITAIRILKRICDGASKEVLRQVTNDEDKWIAKEAKEALKELGEER